MPFDNALDDEEQTPASRRFNEISSVQMKIGKINERMRWMHNSFDKELTDVMKCVDKLMVERQRVNS